MSRRKLDLSSICPVKKAIPTLRADINPDIISTKPTHNPMLTPPAIPAPTPIIPPKTSLIIPSADRSKIIAKLNLYIDTFPEKVGKRHGNFDKMSDEELVAAEVNFKSLVNSGNHLNAVVTMSQQALSLYEFVLVNMMDVPVAGVSKVGQTPEWKEAMQALALKHMDSLTFQTEPEMKLLYLLFMHSAVAYSAGSPPENTPQIPQHPTGIQVQKTMQPPRNNPALNSLNQQFNDL